MTHTHAPGARASLARCALALATVSAIAACASAPRAPEPLLSAVTEAQYERITLPLAIAYGHQVRDNYRAHIDRQFRRENKTTLAAIAMSAAALATGVSEGSTDIVLGLGLATASLVTATRYRNTRLIQATYSAGALAVSCTLEAVAPLESAYVFVDTLRADLGEAEPDGMTTLAASLQELQSVLDRIRGELDDENWIAFLGSREGIEANAALTAGRSAIRAGRQAIDLLDRSGNMLYTAIARIQSEVDQAMITARPDIGSLVQSLGTGLPSMAGLVTARPSIFAIGPRPAAVEPTDALALRSDLADALENATDNVVARTAFVTQIVERMNDRPSAETLDACNVDVDAAGFSFSVEPDQEISIAQPTADLQLTYRISGGVSPYGVQPIGVSPASGIEVVSIDTFGTVTLRLSPGLDTGDYDFLFHDAGRGQELRKVVILPASPGQNGSEPGRGAAVEGGPGARGAVAQPAAPEPDPRVLAVQQELNALARQANGTVIAEDGLFGDDTRAAIRALLEEQSPPNAPAEDDAALLAQAERLLGLE